MYLANPTDTCFGEPSDALSLTTTPSHRFAGERRPSRQGRRLAWEERHSLNMVSVHPDNGVERFTPYVAPAAWRDCAPLCIFLV